ncbi:MAG: putative acid sphingomyelinase-like phosphodiesterase [Bacteriovoracaceae bacterium]|nr:putative acid sphingomyelinase-like phosphodiesterase [Bacteriovoracaceae bacterium]
MSDLHFNPLQDPSIVKWLIEAPISNWNSVFESSALKSLGSYGADSNYLLFKSSLLAMRKANRNPSAVIINGDFLVHHFEENFKRIFPALSHSSFEKFSEKTIQFIAAEILKTFPNSQIIPSFGNNDSSCGDYKMSPHSEFMKVFAVSWKKAIHVDKKNFSTFETKGYYSTLLHFGATSKIRAIVLNGTYWSPRYSNECGNKRDTPDSDQFSWLENQLKESEERGEKIWLINHIPAGIDLFKTFSEKTSPCESKKIVFMYTESNNAKLLSLIHKYSNSFDLILTGHTHLNDFRLYEGKVNPVPGITIPSISPIYKNNPSFEILSLDPEKFSPDNLYVYHLPLSASSPVWKNEYNYTKAYDLSEISSPSLMKLLDSLESDSKVQDKFSRYFTAEAPSSNLALKDWKAYTCGLANLDSESFSECYCE